MRPLWALLLGVIAGAAVAQDPGQQAAELQQQVVQQQITQQQITQQQVALINQQQLDTAANASLAPYQIALATPRLRVRPSAVAGMSIIEMKDSSRGASIFYTANGWTPTAASERYLGPVTVSNGTVVQAIAIGPGGQRSYIASLPATQPAAVGWQPDTVKGPLRLSSLAAGTRLPFLFSQPVTSQGHRVGDKLPIALAEDLYLNGKLAAQKGTPGVALVTQVDNSHVFGLPGSISFALQSVTLLDGTVVSLRGVETMQGPDRTRKAVWTSVVPLAGLAVHGGDATIAAGSRCEAQVL